MRKTQTLPFNDVVELGTDIGRVKGLDAANAEVAGRISLGLFFAETNGRQNIGNARANTYEGSLQTGVSEDRDPVLSARDATEEARVGNLDHRLNHWTAVRDGLMDAQADLFSANTTIVKALPNAMSDIKLYPAGCFVHPRRQFREWALSGMKRPAGKLTGDEFRWNQAPIPKPADNQVLVRNLWLSFRPHSAQLDVSRYLRANDPGWRGHACV